MIGIDLKVGISLLGTFVSNFSMQTHLNIASTTNATDVVFYESIFLLAPTGALVLMMVRDISLAPAFSDFHSVH